jgi:hypothetical protein
VIESLRGLFPLKIGSVEIDVLEGPAEGHHPNADEVWVVARVITYEANGWVRDILQQDVMIAPHPNLLADAERVRNCIEAHVDVLTEVFARQAPGEGAAVPAELLHVADLLTLRKANTREEFAVALSARKRLGRRLGH